VEEACLTREKVACPQSEPARTVLIVEDDDITRDLLGILLRRAGYQVALAADGQEALDVLTHDLKPDLILLDMMMPRLDGWGFLEAKARRPSLGAVPVLISTALGDLNRDRAASLGAIGVLHKPIDIASLLAEVDHCCRP
jgi:two-component system chemotaxis response regulator CheY